MAEPIEELKRWELHCKLLAVGILILGVGILCGLFYLTGQRCEHAVLLQQLAK